MSWQKDIERIPDVRASWDVDLTNLSTFRMASRGDLIEIRSLPALAQVLKTLSAARVSYRVLGWGANQVLAPQEKDVLLKLELPFDASVFEEAHAEYVLPASVGLNLLTSHALKFGLLGWDALTGIPASLGGAVYMNAGTNLGEIARILKSVEVMEPNGVIRREAIGPTHFSYRKNHFVRPGEVIVGATLKNIGTDPGIPEKIRRYQELRRQTQPLATRNCGCVFKNAAPTKQAGRLIDLTGLKELSVGALRVSPRHANFMENAGGATADDFFLLVNAINQQMRLHWGLAFELEVKAL